MIHERILSSGKVGIFTHINPDGDALGSSLGLAGYVSLTGREFLIFLPSQPGESLSFMIPESMKDSIVVWNPEKEREMAKAVNSCDLLIGLDFNTPDRTGEFCRFIIEGKQPKILIDHHLNPATEHFDEVYSKTEVSSTCELLYSILKTMPEINGDASIMPSLTRESLLTGLTTDTNNFANSTYPSTIRMVSELLEAGTDRDAIIHNLYFRYPERRVRAQGYILDRLLHITSSGVAYIIIDRATQNLFGLKDGDTEGFVNIPLSIEGVRMSFLLKQELTGTKVRVSIRSKKGTSAQQCAARYFHGGGHENASGGKLSIGEDIQSIEDAAAYIEKHTSDFFAEG